MLTAADSDAELDRCTGSSVVWWWE